MSFVRAARALAVATPALLIVAAGGPGCGRSVLDEFYDPFADSTPDASTDFGAPTADVASAPEEIAPARCERPGDPCCATAEGPACGGGLACDPATSACVACGASGQACCKAGCNAGLACDLEPGSALGVCTAACGLQDSSCCRGGQCETGTSCSTKDETGTCKPCGLPGLTCCRGDCWIGVCAVTDAPRFCVSCGQSGQPCCDQFPGPQCEESAACDRPTDERRGMCTQACGTEGNACCRSGGCREGLQCTTGDETGWCGRCGEIGQPCCEGRCRGSGRCAAQGVCQS